MNLSDSQLGFRSCELALNSIFNSWKLSLDIKHNVITISLKLLIQWICSVRVLYFLKSSFILFVYQIILMLDLIKFRV